MVIKCYFDVQWQGPGGGNQSGRVPSNIYDGVVPKTAEDFGAPHIHAPDKAHVSMLRHSTSPTLGQMIEETDGLTTDDVGNRPGPKRASNTGSGSPGACWEEKIEKEGLMEGYRPKPQSFFCRYRVFTILWPENAWDAAGSICRDEGEMPYSKTRRMIVVGSNPRHYVCIPIQTYQGTGIARKGIRASDHAIIYTGRESQPIPGAASNLLAPAVRVSPDTRCKLDAMSRINYSAPCTSDFGVKVRDFGRVHPASQEALLHQFKNVWNSVACRTNSRGPGWDRHGASSRTSQQVTGSVATGDTLRDQCGDPVYFTPDGVLERSKVGHDQTVRVWEPSQRLQPSCKSLLAEFNGALIVVIMKLSDLWDHGRHKGIEWIMWVNESEWSDKQLVRRGEYLGRLRKLIRERYRLDLWTYMPSLERMSPHSPLRQANGMIGSSLQQSITHFKEGMEILIRSMTPGKTSLFTAMFGGSFVPGAFGQTIEPGGLSGRFSPAEVELHQGNWLATDPTNSDGVFIALLSGCVCELVVAYKLRPFDRYKSRAIGTCMLSILLLCGFYATNMRQVMFFEWVGMNIMLVLSGAIHAAFESCAEDDDDQGEPGNEKTALLE